MKKIAVITSGLLPMPAVKDGAIEMLLQYVLDYNEENCICNFDVFSIYNKEAENLAKRYKNTNFHFIKINSLLYSIYFNYCRVRRKFGNKDPNFQLFFIKKILKDLKSSNYDFILVESDNHFAYEVISNIDIPVILYLHNDKLNDETLHGEEIIKKVYKVFTVSEFLKKRVLTLGQEYISKVEVILNGIDLILFQNFNKMQCRRNYRKILNFDDTDFVFLFVGRIEYNKGVFEMIKAFNKLKGNVKLLIVGGSFHGSNKKSKYTKKVYKEAIKSNGKIVFTGYIAHDTLPCYYASADAMVVPSIWDEPAGLVNIEALAFGLPLIVSDVGGVAEYTLSSALLVKKDNKYIDNLYMAMDYVMSNRKLYLNFKQNKSLKFFNKEEYCKRFFNSLIKAVEDEKDFNN